MDRNKIMGMLSPFIAMGVVLLYTGVFDSYITPIMKVYIIRTLAMAFYYVIFDFAYKGLGEKVPLFRKNREVGFVLCFALSIIFGFLSVIQIEESILGNEVHH